ncbi:MAG TPA: hypothetical protein VFE33_13255 [Thermoanaerobaculia bacterium]|nr:hypothetical protein [Thermoanaerobaculia bacterium]
MAARFAELGVEAPFPGLRSFETEESFLFFGRETHTEELLRRLSEHRFLAIVGTSGSGKSSLVRAGLLPALHRGYLAGATSRWRFALLRPGTAPLDALAAALASKGVLGQEVTALRKTLGTSSGGLVAAVRQAGLAPGESLLLVVDQFEELFRFAPASPHADGRSQAALFVRLLLHAVESVVPIYVVLTMRSDYQGDCAQFPGLPEALNRSQYLVPRLTLDQRRQTIVRPLEIMEAGATPRLVNRLLNDAGDDPDQLPVLQHALLLTYRHWQEAGGQGDVDLPDYEAIGGIAEALGRHGDEILAGLPEADQRLTERIFRCLTTRERGRVIRRPKELGALYDVVGADDEATRARVNDVVSIFARREHSLLMVSAPTLAPGTVVDITHESLMRKWPKLVGWIEAEAKSAEWYSDLARDAGLHSDTQAGLWRDPKLSEVLARRDREDWSEAWALQYARPDDPPFAEVAGFLDESARVQAEERRHEELQQRTVLDRAQVLMRRFKRTSISLSLFLVILVAGGFVVYFLQKQNESRVKALTGKYLAVQQDLSTAQQEAAENRALKEKAENQLGKVGPAEKARLNEQLAALQAKYSASLTSADAYQRQLNEIQQSLDHANSDHKTLLDRIQALQKRIQELQTQLNSVKGERDKLQSDQASAANEYTALTKRYNELRAQLNAAKVDLYRFHLAAAQRTMARPIFKVVPQFSVVHLTGEPFGGTVAIGVGDVLVGNLSTIRVYVWTTDGDARLPEEFHGSRGRSERLFGLLDQDRLCSAAGAPACYQVRKIDTILGRQRSGSFLHDGVRYEIVAMGWSNGVEGQQDSISLAIYPAPEAAK